MKKFDADLSLFKSSDFAHVYEPGMLNTNHVFFEYVYFTAAAEDSYLLSDAIVLDADFLHDFLPAYPICVELGQHT